MKIKFLNLILTLKRKIWIFRLNYIKYLCDLSAICTDLKIPFDKSDRILFMADKRINKKENLNK